MCTTFKGGAARRGAAVFSVLPRADCRSPFVRPRFPHEGPAPPAETEAGGGGGDSDWREDAADMMWRLSHAGRIAAVRGELQLLRAALHKAAPPRPPPLPLFPFIPRPLQSHREKKRERKKEKKRERERRRAHACVERFCDGGGGARRARAVTAGRRCARVCLCRM